MIKQCDECGRDVEMSYHRLEMYHRQKAKGRPGRVFCHRDCSTKYLNRIASAKRKEQRRLIKQYNDIAGNSKEAVVTLVEYDSLSDMPDLPVQSEDFIPPDEQWRLRSRKN